MNKEDYSKYYIQGSDHYLIPKDIFDELFNEMNNWKKGAQKQKEVIDKAVELLGNYKHYSTPDEKQEIIEYLKEKKNELYKKLSDYNDLARIGKETDIEFFEALILERRIDVYEEILSKIEKS